MTLLDEIIDLLSRKDGSINDALLKTKILLHKIGHKELTEWVNHELNGYPEDVNLPEYRLLPAQVLANISNPRMRYTSHPIPLGHLDDDKRETLETARMGDSLAVLEKLTEKEGRLQSQIPMDLNWTLGQGLGNGYNVEQAWCSIEQSRVAQIFIQVRSRLLDFMLELQDQIGPDVSDSEVKVRAAPIDAAGLFNSAIFGDNTTIVVGNNNSQDIQNISVRAGDFDALAKELRGSGVSQNDIDSLADAIREDGHASEH